MAKLVDIFAAKNTNKLFEMIDNYIYMYHTDEYIVLPIYPSSINDSQKSNFQSNTPLMRSAPIWSYTGSGERSISFSFDMHREYMTQVNYGKSNLKLEMDDDYVDTMIKRIQACAVPRYDSGEKMVDPPLVAVRIGDEIFIKGYVSTGPAITYKTPIINLNGKDRYALVEIQFGVTEVEPYSAAEVAIAGSFRGLSTSMERNLWKPSGSLSSGVGSITNASMVGGGGSGMRLMATR